MIYPTFLSYCVDFSILQVSACPVPDDEPARSLHPRSATPRCSLQRSPSLASATDMQGRIVAWCLQCTVSCGPIDPREVVRLCIVDGCDLTTGLAARRCVLSSHHVSDRISIWASGRPGASRVASRFHGSITPCTMSGPKFSILHCPSPRRCLTKLLDVHHG